MPTNFVGGQNIVLTRESGKGTLLTIPARALTALIRIKSGGVNFSLDDTDPIVNNPEPLTLERGQSINLTHSDNMTSILTKFRLKLAPNRKEAKVLVLYFE